MDHVETSLPDGSAAQATASSLSSLGTLPSPPSYPWLGHVAHLARGALHLTLERWTEQYGPLYRLTLPRTTVVVVSDLALIRQVARARPHTYRRMSSMASLVDEIIGPGVFTAEGERWRRQRKLVTAALGPRNVRAFHAHIARSVERLRARWAAAAERRDAVDVLGDLMLFTADVTTSIAFGLDVNTIERGDHLLRRHLAQVFPAFERRFKLPFPYWRYVRLPSDRALERAVEALRRELAPVIAEARLALASAPRDADESATSFLEALLTAANEEGEPLGDDEVLGNALTVLLAGEDTTASTVAWALHHLSHEPALLDALREELARARQEGALTPERTRELPLLEATLKETLRLRPPAPVLTLEALVATELAGLALPAGTVVWTLPRPAALDPLLFAEPRAFRPTRWLEASEAQEAALMSFGYGPRLCPGRSLALFEAALLVAMVVDHFTLEPTSAADAVQESHRFTMAPEGLALRLARRTRTGDERSTS